MKQLNRKQDPKETDKAYKKRVVDFYKSERALLKEHRPIRLGIQNKNKPKDLAEIIHRLHILKEATYFADDKGGTHCEVSRSRTENDLYLLIKHYINPKIQFKFVSELLWAMSNDNFLHCGFCNTIHRHTYTPRTLSTTEKQIRDYLEKKDLNLKVKEE